MKKRFRLTVIEAWILLIMLGSIILTIWPQIEIVKEAQYRQECVANLISIMIATRLYEVREGGRYSEKSTRVLVEKGYLSEEFFCPAAGVYYRIDPETGLVLCPSGRSGHTWPTSE